MFFFYVFMQKSGSIVRNIMENTCEEKLITLFIMTLGLANCLTNVDTTEH